MRIEEMKAVSSTRAIIFRSPRDEFPGGLRQRIVISLALPYPGLNNP